LTAQEQSSRLQEAPSLSGESISLVCKDGKLCAVIRKKNSQGKRMNEYGKGAHTYTKEKHKPEEEEQAAQNRRT
jgi:hypothetical protein